MYCWGCKKKKGERRNTLCNPVPRKEKNQRDIRMNDDTEKCEDDQRGKENSTSRKSFLWT